MPEKDVLIIIGLSFVMLLGLSLPVILQGLNFTRTTTDIFAYSAAADYLRQYGINPVNLTNTFNFWGYSIFLADAKRLGLLYILSFVNIMLRTDSSFTFLPLSLVFINLSIINSCVLFLMKKANKRIIILFIILAHLNTLYLSSGFRGFMSQAGAMPIYVLGIILFADLIDNFQNYDYLSLLIVPLILSGVLAVYPAYLPYCLLFGGLYLVMTKFSEIRTTTSFNALRYHLPKLIYVLILQVLLSYKSIESFIKGFQKKFLPVISGNALSAGDIHFYVPPYELIGVFPHLHVSPESFLLRNLDKLAAANVAHMLTILVQVLFYLLTFIVISLMIMYLRKPGRLRNRFICIGLTFIISGFITYIQNYTYGYYKNISGFSIFFIVIFLSAVDFYLVNNSWQRYIRVCAGSLILGIILLNVASTTITLFKYTEGINEMNRFRELTYLNKPLPDNAAVLSLEEDPFFQLTEIYFMRPASLVIRNPNKAIKDNIPSSHNDYQYILIRNADGVRPGEIPIISGTDFSIYDKQYLTI